MRKLVVTNAIKLDRSNFLPSVSFIISIFSVPFFYKEKLAIGIFKNDFFFIWINGSLCWIYVAVFSKIIFDAVTGVLLVALANVILLLLISSFFDENSIYAVITFVCCISIVRYLMSVFQSKWSIIILGALFLSYFIQVCIGYVQAINNHWQILSIHGWLYNSGFFANYLTSMTPMFLAGFVSRNRFQKITRIGFLIAYFAASFLLIATIARAAIIGTLVGSLWVLLCHQSRVEIKWFLLSVPVIILASVSSYKVKRDSALGRLTIYRVAANMIKEHPLTGVGPNRFAACYNNYQAEYFRTGKASIEPELLADNTFEAFNSIIQILVEYGVIGLLLLGMLAYCLLSKRKNTSDALATRWLKRGSYGCLISIMVSSLFSNPFHVTPILLIFCFHVSVILSQKTRSFIVPSKRNRFPLVAATLFTLFILTYVFVQHIAEKKWKMAADLAVYDNFNKAKKFYAGAYPYLKTNGDFLYNYGAEAYLAGNYNLAINLLTQATHYTSFSNLFVYLADAFAATGKYELAEENYLHAIYMVPSHIFPKFQLIQLYKKWQKPDQARSWTIKTLNYPIKVRSEFVQQLIAELKNDM